MSASENGKRNRGQAAGDEALPDLSKRRKTNYEVDNSGWEQGQDYNLEFSHDDYNIGWVCALPIEMAAAIAMLDNVHPSLHSSSNDSNAYTLGNIGLHNIVIACLPSGHYGTNNAATVANNMCRSFPFIRICFMVGIGGGVPGNVDVRLGDIVVSDRVVQYDFGKTVQNSCFQRTGIVNRPPQDIMTAVSKLRANHESACSQIPSILSKMLEQNPTMAKYTHPGPLQDQLFQNTYNHIQSQPDCNKCDPSRLVNRPSRHSTHPNIHYGVIASGNQVMKDAKTRDKLAQELDALCFEMEAAGLMDTSRCLVIRGICDYSDSHKNKQWQEYAAAVAAAYAKELLSAIPSKAPSKLLPPTIGTQSATEQLSLSDRRKDVLDSLRFEEFDSRQVNIKAAHAKTCRWFLKDPNYKDWQDHNKHDEHHGFLWISGKPGAGKSTLMKFVYTQAKKKAAGNAATISFFFNARGDDLEKSTEGMHRSLLLQLLEKLPDLQEVLDDPDYAPRNRGGYCSWEVETLQGLFSQAVQRLGERRLTCFVDALDEGNESQVIDMVRYFEDLAEHAILNRANLYICFSSRHYPYIDIRNGRKLILEDQDGHRQDLDNYIQSSLRAGVGNAAGEIKSTILQKAAGVFMWVVLVVDILNKEFRRGRIFAVRKRLEEIPDKLSELFKDMLRRDQDNMEDFLLCIQWILYAKRPLKCEEFYFAIVSGLDPENLAEWNSQNVTPDDQKRFVLSSSKGLAEITKSKDKTVQFIHESVRDFLIKDNGLRDLWPELGEDFQSLSHDRLKQCCHSYIKVDISVRLSFDEKLPKASSDAAKALRQRVSEKFPFLEYATRHVLNHSNAATNTLPQDEFVKEFPLNTWINLHNLFEKHELRRYKPTVSLLYILAENNLARLIKITLRHNPKINIQGGRYHYPLFAALASGHRDAVKALLQLETSTPPENDISAQLEYGRNVTVRKDETPLLWALKRGHLALAKLLIDLGALGLGDFIEGEVQMALSLAAENGHDAVIKPLLAFTGADANSKDGYGWTPLWRAAANGHKAVVKLLLETPLWEAANEHKAVAKLLLATEGIDAILKDRSGQTPLSWAAENGYEAVAKLLVATEGIDANLKDRSGRTPLSWAAENGYEAVVKLLVATEGVDANSKDRSGQTPLSWAAANGHEAVVKLLVATEGVDANSEDRSGRTPLSKAAASGHEAVVKLLVMTKGVDANSEDRSGRTPLSKAAASGHEAVVKLLVATEGVDANSKDQSGRTPLLWAAANGHEAVVKLLVATEGVDANSEDRSGRTPLSKAAASGHEAVVKLLVATEGVNANSEDQWGQTPLSWAAENGHEAVVKLLVATEGVDANSEDQWGRTPLSWAAANGHEVVVKLLVATEGVDANLEDRSGRTPLSKAAASGHEAVVKLLVATEGVNANSKDQSEGRTPLSWAAANGHEAVVKLLVATEGVDANSKDQWGRTPLSMAAANGHEAVVKLLQKYR